MVTNIRCKEVCHGCSKNILKHNLIVICRKCQKKFYNYDFIDKSWSCWECNSVEECRYNPFKSYRYDKYSQPDSNSFSEIHQIENLLENCNRYDLHELNNHIMKNSIKPLSIMFKNIDGVTSNFDVFSTKITSTNDKLSVITLARTRPFEAQRLGAEFFCKEHTKPLFNKLGILAFQNLFNYQICL